MSVEADLPAYLRETADGCTIAIRVQPGAKRTVIVGVCGEGERAQLKIALQAPPVDGKANEVLIDYLAKSFSIARSRVRILHGERDRNKIVALTGAMVSNAEAVLQRLL